MDNSMFGMKDVYECTLKAPYDVQMGNLVIQAGEPIVIFDSLQMVNFNEIKDYIYARGGYGNQAWVSWERTKELYLSFSQGIFSRIHLAILSNVEMREHVQPVIPMWETVESDENLQAYLKHKPCDKDIWAYKKSTGENVRGSWETIGEDENEKYRITFIDIDPYEDIQISYNYEGESADIIHFGRHLLNGFFSLTMKTRLKDDRTGKTVTGVFSAPRVKLMSDFSIRLGSDAPPAVGNFNIVAMPTGPKGSEKVMDFILLNDDVDSDF